MRLHLVALPHTQLTNDYLSCAYSQKIVKFVKMMQQDHEIFLYANDRSALPGCEHISILSESERAGWFGDGFNTVTTPLQWDNRMPYWRLFNDRTVSEIKKRYRHKDMLLLIAGDCQRPISDQFTNEMVACEWGVGYEGIFTNFCAFESYAWMHYVYGKKGIINGRAFDAVIPNFFDTSDFEIPGFKPRKEDYLLYIGRLVNRKGLDTAVEIAKNTGYPLVVAGPGVIKHGPGFIEYPEGRITGDIEYIGELDKTRRTLAMSKARATLTPTYYVGPFEGVAVESMLCGTPVVASDWGAFAETVTKTTGRRFRTLREGVDAVREAVKFCNPVWVKKEAVSKYSLEAVRPLFNQWFDNLQTLWDRGWYSV